MRDMFHTAQKALFIEPLPRYVQIVAPIVVTDA